jgi:hypothetical protein
LSIGAQDDGFSPFYGAIDAVHLYDYAITQADIEGLASIVDDEYSFFGYQKQSINDLTITSDVANKPQSKLWQHNNDYWMILPDVTGTWVWRLDDLSWVKVFQISADQNAKADVKLASSSTGLVHAVLHSGGETQLVSLEYITGVSPSYQFWSQRPFLVALPPGSDTETVTLELDSNEVMWVVRDFGSTVEVLYSYSPYSDWLNSSITVDSNISEDDIASIVQVGTQGIGVMWSNQNTQRFGFVYHDDLNAPTVWSAPEFPGGSNALNVGKGLADDHINLVSASDGSVYAAIKTGYDDQVSVNLGLFVRSPSGVWGDIITLDISPGTATRPIVLINEIDSTISYVYSNSTVGGSIVYTQASLTDLVFAPKRLLISSSELTNTSSMKQSYGDSLVLLATPHIGGQSSTTLKSIVLQKPLP